MIWDDRPASARRCAARLEAAGFRCKTAHAATKPEFQKLLTSSGWELLLCADAFLGEDPAALVREAGVPAPLLYFVRAGERGGKTPSPARQAEALRAGAADYLLPEDWDRLPCVIERALRLGRLEEAHQRADAARAGAERRLQTVLDHNPDILLVIQAVTGTILRANRAVQNLLGYQEEELAGRHFSALFPLENEPAVGDLMARFRVRGGVFEGQRFLCVDGSVRPLDVTAEIVAWGQTQAILVTLHDAEARESLERQAFWNGHSAARCLDPLLWTEADGLICHLNEAACRLLGYRPEELLGRPLAEIDPGFGAGLWPLHWEEVKARGRFLLTTRLKRKEGDSLAVEAEVLHLRHNGRDYHCLLARTPESA
ncbi:MAG: PAS domain S-box protein [Verrucomicrobium sp.]|nr:PAS domain S-box protein [Verrucomicrobium sp.]